MSKILVTGGSGFIGSHLVETLAQAGHDVVIYDLEAPPREVAALAGFVRGDILDRDRLQKSLQKVEFIYNLAAEANVNRFFESPLYSNLVTSQGVLTVLEAARHTGVKRVLQASTEWVYGSASESGSEAKSEAEKDNPILETEPVAARPDHLYTSSKIAAELFCQNYQRLYGVGFTIMRFGIPYGERGRAETVTPTFLKRIQTGQEIQIHGDGSQTRQFIYVGDLAKGCASCLQEQATNEIFNLNGDKLITVLDVVRTLEAVTGTKGNVKFVEDRAGNFKGRFISSEKARARLDWQPQVAYRDGISRLVEWAMASRGGSSGGSKA